MLRLILHQACMHLSLLSHIVSYLSEAFVLSFTTRTLSRVWPDMSLKNVQALYRPRITFSTDEIGLQFHFHKFSRR